MASVVMPRSTTVKIFVLVVCCLALLPTAAAPAAEAPSAANTEWQRTVRAAEQEGQVVVYKIAEDTEWNAFQKRFPKIKLVLVHATAAQHLQRIMAERRAEKFIPDVVRLGGGTSTTLYRANALERIPPALILPEVKEPGKWFEGRHHYNDGDNQYTFVYAAFPLRLLGYNTKLLEANTITSFADLLDAKWHGKITLKDPQDPGGGSPLLFLFHNPQLGPDYIKKLLTLGGLTLVRIERQQTDWVASGKFPVAITAKAEDFDEAKRRGLPVDMLDPHAMREGAGLEAGGTMISLMNRAPHPNAAKVLINWFLSREGQTIIQKRGANLPSHNSLREDIPKEDLPPAIQRQKGVKYIRLWGPEVWDRTPIQKFISEVVK